MGANRDDVWCPKLAIPIDWWACWGDMVRTGEGEN